MDSNKSDNKPTLTLSTQHLQILDYAQTLFSRQSLRKNLYLSPKMSAPLLIPLFVIAEERKIAQITHDQALLIQALQMCDLVIVLHEKRLIEIIEYPTIKIERKYAHLLSNFEERLKKYTEKDKGSIKYNITKQISEDGFFYITLRELENPKILEILVHEFNQEAPQKIVYTKQAMYEDIRQGIQKQKKLKKQSISKMQYNKDIISLDRPQPIFIRKAIQSSEQQQQELKQKIVKKQERKGKNKKSNGHKAYKESKPVIDDKDFPSLS